MVRINKKKILRDISRLPIADALRSSRQAMALGVSIILVVLVSGVWNIPFNPFDNSTDAAAVTVDATLNATDANYSSSQPRIVFISDTTGYLFYQESTGVCAYSKTTDSGGSWGTSVTVDAQTDCVDVSVWYDRWTPGDTTGTNIYIFTYDTGNSDVWYNTLDTSGDTLALGTSPVSVSTGVGNTLDNALERPSATKGTDGKLYVGMHDAGAGSASFILACSATCTTGGNWAAAGTTPIDTQALDHLLLVPLASAKILAIRYDDSAADIQSKVWSGSAWDGAWTNIDIIAPSNTTYKAKFSATVNRTNNNVYLTYVADNVTIGTDDDIRTAVYNGTKWTTKANVIIDSCSTTVCNDRGVTGAKIAVNDRNGDVFVAYTARTTPGTATTTNIYWKKSTDNMNTWSSATGPLNASGIDTFGPFMNLMSDERLYVAWDDFATDDMLGEVVADIAAPTFEQSGYRWFDNRVTDWWDTSWGSRRKITLDNSASVDDLVDFPALVSLTSSNIDYAKTQNSGQDLRFVDTDGTLLKYEIETWDEAGTSEVWVKVPKIDAASNTDFVYMYYDNSAASAGQDPSGVWSNSYNSVWHLSEDPTGASPPMKDSTTNGLHMSPYNYAGMTSGDQVAGKISGAIDLDANDGLESPDNSLFEPSSDMTIGGWTNITSNTVDQILMYKNHGGAPWFGYGLSIPNTGKPQFNYRNTSTTLSTANYTGAALSLGWHYIVGVRTGNVLKIYVDGSDASTTTGAPTGTIYNSNSALNLGNAYRTSEPSRMIDEMRVSGAARSADWMSADYLTQTNAMNTFGSEESIPASSYTLAANNTVAVASIGGGKWRLRLMIHVATDSISAGTKSFKLQFAGKGGGSCASPSGVPSSYTDVTTTTDIAYYDNASFADGLRAIGSADWPAHSTDIDVIQTYDEANNFSNSSAILSGQDGSWDLVLYDRSAPISTYYCFRAVLSDGTVLGTYSQYPEIQTATPGTADQMRHGSWFSDEAERYFTF